MHINSIVFMQGFWWCGLYPLNPKCMCWELALNELGRGLKQTKYTDYEIIPTSNEISTKEKLFEDIV